jgi:YVTN family beta-propeller protein
MLQSSIRMRTCLTGLVVCLAVSACSRQETPAEDEGRGATAGSVPDGPRVFVTNEVSGDLTVIDAVGGQVVGTIPVGKRPRGIALGPDGSTLYVALSGTPIGGPNVDEDTLPPADPTADGIGVVSADQMRLLRVIPGGSDPEMVAVSNDGTRLFVANEDVGLASAIDANDGRVLGTVEVGGEPEGVNVRPDGGVVYVTSEDDNTVTVIDTATLKAVATIPVGARPRSTAFLPDSSRAYVPGENSGTITVIDAQAHKVLETITLTGEDDLVRPMGTAVSPDGAHLFVTTGRGRHVVIIDTATNMQIAAIEVGERPWGIAVSSDGRTLYTANGPSNDVSIVDVESRTVRARVPAGDRPWGVAYVP